MQRKQRPDSDRADVQLHAGAWGRDWRDQVARASGLNFLMGIWLVSSPFVLAYGDDPIWNPILFGSALAVMGFVRATRAFERAWLSSVNLFIGGWIFASAFWLADATAVSWNDAVSGVIIIGLALWSMSATRRARARTSEPRAHLRPPAA